MNNTTKVIIAVGSLGLVGLGLFLYFKNKKDSTQNQEEESVPQGEVSVTTKTALPTEPSEGRPNIVAQTKNFEDLKKNLGANVRASGNVVSVKFNGGKNQADFYNNDRVIISTVGKSGFLVKGKYSNGGRTIVLDNGKNITSGSVWGNLLNAIK